MQIATAETLKSKNSFFAELAQAGKEQKLLIIVIFAYILSAFLISFQIESRYDWVGAIEGLVTTIILGPLLAFCAYTLYVMTYIRPSRLTYFLISEMRCYLTRSRIIHAIPVMFLFPVFTSAFTYFKLAIPSIHPYTWDRRLAQLDLAIHGGTHPWVWLQYVLGHPLISSVINIFYHLWFFIVFATIYWLAFNTKEPALRMRFLTSFVLSWIILGNVVATLLSSVGPCYYGYLVAGENPYSPLMIYLNEAGKHVPLWALDVQKLLWDGHEKNMTVLGISAMPSMHVSSAVLLALLGLKINRQVGIVLVFFTVITMIGSVHLGWHYAVDGYVGAIGAYLIWHAVGYMIASPPKELVDHIVYNHRDSELNGNCQ